MCFVASLASRDVGVFWRLADEQQRRVFTEHARQR
ncbi:MAG: hypothetical protein ACJA0V_002216, partial [Planctomycetota bacterium]